MMQICLEQGYRIPTSSPDTWDKKYTDVMLTGLTGLTNTVKSDELKDQDGVIIGVAYITLVLRKLKEIVL